jgi:hypothetical protein
VTGLTNGTTYDFIVKAVRFGIDGESSNELSATPQAPSNGGGTYIPIQPVAPSNGIDVLVNGKMENAGTATTTKVMINR